MSIKLTIDIAIIKKDTTLSEYLQIITDKLTTFVKLAHISGLQARLYKVVISTIYWKFYKFLRAKVS